MKRKLIYILKCLIASLLYVFSIQYFISPHHLYSGGILGCSQLIDFYLPNGNYSGILYFLLNIPIFLIALKPLGKKFIIKSFIIMVLQSILFTLISIPNRILVEDTLTSCFIASILCGVSTAMIWSMFASSGGTEVLGMTVAKKYSNINVGTVSTAFNIILYIIYGFLFNIETVVYTIIFGTLTSIIADKLHKQNNIVTVYIFCDKWKEINHYITSDLNRSSTSWMGAGAYSDQLKHIVFTVISKHDLEQLQHNIKEIDKNAFIVINESLYTIGNFEKRLS